MTLEQDLFWGSLGLFFGAGATILLTRKKRSLFVLVALAVLLFVLFYLGGLLGFFAGLGLRMYVLKAPRK
ncbi:MAG TPA: hypothetical protein VGQ00_01955 [Candidatus Norongarragalinales archaeon]|jgi:hypothetical protein|nr:hypothetical protein [Candidatus Norongarragalinales archaeon]